MITQSTKVETINRLEKFINDAEKFGKYPSNTAGALLSALNIVTNGLTNDEPSDLEYIAEHVEDIFHRQVNKLNLSPKSMQTYMSRVRKIIRDFKTYGQDSKAMHAWKPKRISISRTAPATGQPEDSGNSTSSGVVAIVSGTKTTGLKTLLWSLSRGRFMQIQLPMDLDTNDVERIKKLLDLEAEVAQNSVS